jgi:hypothetical protein
MVFLRRCWCSIMREYLSLVSKHQQPIQISFPNELASIIRLLVMNTNNGVTAYRVERIEKLLQ